MQPRPAEGAAQAAQPALSPCPSSAALLCPPPAPGISFPFLLLLHPPSSTAHNKPQGPLALLPVPIVLHPSLLSFPLPSTPRFPLSCLLPGVLAFTPSSDQKLDHSKSSSPDTDTSVTKGGLNVTLNHPAAYAWKVVFAITGSWQYHQEERRISLEDAQGEWCTYHISEGNCPMRIITLAGQLMPSSKPLP